MSCFALSRTLQNVAVFSTHDYERLQTISILKREQPSEYV
jgi:hypothetical protein